MPQSEGWPAFQGKDEGVWVACGEQRQAGGETGPGEASRVVTRSRTDELGTESTVKGRGGEA